MAIFEALTVAPMALLSRLGSPFIASVSLGLAFSSYFFLGNLACATLGVMPSLKAVKLEDDKKVELWAFWNQSASPQFALSTISSSLSYLTAAWLADPTHASLKPWLMIAGMCSLFAPPWTVLVMAPATNKPLLAARERVTRNEKFGLNDTEQRLEHWKKLNFVRMSVGGVAWAIGFCAIILA